MSTEGPSSFRGNFRGRGMAGGARGGSGRGRGRGRGGRGGGNIGGRGRGQEEQVQDKEPGVNQLKARIRQTQRLLAKETLSADVRVESERRLRALEADLAKAELARKEQHNATRYHKIKFFERQKVLRKIKRAAKAALRSGEEGEQAKKQLLEARVDLNYIIHYPKAEKYIALFPSSEPVKEEDATSTSKTDARRATMRKKIRERMDKGELSAEPEKDLMEREGREVGKGKKREREGRLSGDQLGSGQKSERDESGGSSEGVDSAEESEGDESEGSSKGVESAEDSEREGDDEEEEEEGEEEEEESEKPPAKRQKPLTEHKARQQARPTKEKVVPTKKEEKSAVQDDDFFAMGSDSE